MASWAPILLLFGGVMLVVYVLPVLLKLIFRVVIGLLMLLVAFIAISVYSGADTFRLLNDTIAVIGTVAHDVISNFS